MIFCGMNSVSQHTCKLVERWVQHPQLKRQHNTHTHTKTFELLIQWIIIEII